MNDRFTVIFDFDGTLGDTIELVSRIYNENAHLYGALPVSKDEFPELRKLGYKKAMKAKKIRWSVLPKLVLFVSREMKQHMGEVKPYPGVVSMLKELQASGISIGVLTSNDGALVQDFLNSNNFPVFDFVVSEKTMFGKEKALKRIMKRHKLIKEKVIYVGDESRDVVACKKAGIKIIGVTWGAGGKESFIATPPDRQVDTAGELKAAIIEARQ